MPSNNSVAAVAREKVAVLGGGIGALSAAWELAKTDTYEITIYQLGWRLGGKLATGRNQEAGMRIEEHGIHGFLGGYYNAGVMMQEVFHALAQQGADSRHFLTSFKDAFVLQEATVMWENRAGNWSPWLTKLPANGLSYGDLGAVTKAQHGVIGLLNLLGVHLQPSSSGIDQPHLHGLLQTLISALEAASHLANTHLAAHAADVAAQVWQHVRPALASAEPVASVRHALITIDFLLATVHGFFADEIPTKGYQCIDDEDYSAWLARHGASPITLASPMALNTPDITYNFPFGDMTLGPRMSAAAFLQWTLRMSGYVGAFVLPFRAGSGETVLAPIYRALTNKGVRFEFFHKVDALHLSADKKSIASVSMSIQATTRGGAPYQPLVGPVRCAGAQAVDGLMCWPSKPNFDQLEQGATLSAQNIDLESWWTPWQAVGKRTLQAGTDYAHLVLGISLGALPYICKELVADVGNPPVHPGTAYPSRWQALIDEVQTVQTQAMQLWFKEPVSTYLDPSVKLPEGNDWIAGTYVLPISGQADFSSLLNMEAWGADAPKGLFYLCGPMSDSGIPPFDQHDFPAQQRERVRAQSIQYLQATAAPMLPGATTASASTPTTPGSLDFAHLHVPKANDANAHGTQRFDYQFWRANIDPSERYVTCFPGTAKFRLQANGSGYTNLVLAGDWIDTGINVGSVEGAVMGGKLAANAISGTPALADIWGYDPFGVRKRN